MPPFSWNLVILQRLLDNFIYSQTLLISAILIHALLILLQSFVSSLYDLLNISLSVFLRNLSSLPKIDLVCLKLFSSSIFSIKASFSRGFPGDSVVKNLPAIQETQETWVQSLGREDPLEEEMVTHSSILAWDIPWAEEPGGLQSVGSKRVRHE